MISHTHAHYPVAIVWLRRDLRLDDNAALLHAANAADRIVCAFVLDPVLLLQPRRTLPPLLRAEYACTAGHDHPAPIVDRAIASRRAVEVDARTLGHRGRARREGERSPLSRP